MIIVFIVYLYSARYLHVLQDSKHYLTCPTVQVQSNSLVTDIPLTERQRLKDDHFINITLNPAKNSKLSGKGACNGKYR